MGHRTAAGVFGSSVQVEHRDAMRADNEHSRGAQQASEKLNSTVGVNTGTTDRR